MFSSAKSGERSYAMDDKTFMEVSTNETNKANEFETKLASAIEQLILADILCVTTEVVSRISDHFGSDRREVERVSAEQNRLRDEIDKLNRQMGKMAQLQKDTITAIRHVMDQSE